MNPLLLLKFASLIGAFAAGFVVATWRSEALAERAEQRVDAAYRAQTQAMVDRLNAQNAASEKLENELTDRLSSAQTTSESLRHEIESRPTIRQVVEKAVNGECPAVPSVDWRVFQRSFDCAAEPDAKTCLADARGIPVRSVAPDPRDRP